MLFQTLLRRTHAVGIILLATIVALPSFGQVNKSLKKTTSLPITKTRTINVPTRSANRSPFAKLQTTLKLPKMHLNRHQAPAKAETTASPVFEGNAVYYDAWEDDGIGIFKFEAGQEDLITVATSDALNSSLGGIKVGDTFYCACQQTMLGESIYAGRLFDADTWKVKSWTYNMPTNVLAYALTEDPTDGTIYGCFLNEAGNGFELGTMDINSISRTSTICDVKKPYMMMGITSKGVMYAVDSDSYLYIVDKKTGAAEMKGYLGLEFTYISGGYMDTTTDNFYIMVCNDYDNSIYRVDLDEYYADFVCEVPQEAQLTSFWMGKPLANDAAPAAATDLAVSFTNAELTGTLSFTAPTLNYGDEELEDDMTYNVMIDDELKTTGTAKPGEKISVQVTVDSSAKHTFVVYMSNEAGNGPETLIKQYVGYDAPYTVKNVTATRSGNINHIEWTAVTRGANGGYLDPALVTYEVTRMPDNVVVATGIKDTSYDDVVATPKEFTTYIYNVRACQEGLWSNAGESNSLPLGITSLPFQATFDTYEDLEKFTVIDSNGDGKHWRWAQGGSVKVEWNSDLSMDDWMISPAMNLEAGKTYKLTFETKCEGSDVPERLEVKLGNAPTADAMTEDISGPIDITWDKFQKHEYQITPKTSGVQYVGFHGISDADMYIIYVDNIVIEAGTSAGSPLKPVFDYKPDYNGANKVTLNITAPTEDVSGNALKTMSKLEVRSTESVLKTFYDVAPGQQLQCDFEYATSGYMTFQCVAYSADGEEGAVEAKNIYVGLNYGGTPQNVNIQETGNTGKVTISWDSLDKDIEGKNINPDLVSYVIYNSSNEVVGKTSSTTFTTNALGTSTQRFINYCVVSKTTRGENTETPGVTDMIPVGTPYPLPYEETLANGKLSHSYGQEGTGTWGTYPLSESEYVFEYAPDMTGDMGTLLSGKVSLEYATHPYLSLAVYAYDGADGKQSANINELDVMVRKLGTNEWQTMKTISLADGNGWVTYMVDISAYNGQTVQFGLQGVANKGSYSIYVDGLNIIDRKNYDLTCKNMEARSRGEIGSDIIFVATVSNEGLQAADNYTVNFYRNGKVIGSQDGVMLEPGSGIAVKFQDTVSAIFDDEMSYQIGIEWSADEKADNDKTEEWIVEVPHADGPVVEDLTATQSASGVILNWSAPDVAGITATTTETFENSESFSVNKVEGWSFIDADQGRTYGLANEYPNIYSKMAYIIYDVADEAMSLGYEMMSGTKAMVSIASLAGKNDDWAISPELSGNAQTITFYARSIADTYGLESFEFLTSTSTGESLTQNDFTLVEKVTDVPNGWTQYTYQIPAGCTHFAIRCVSADRLALLIDDVTYEAAGAQNLEIKGYNIYCNEKKLNSNIVTSCNYNAPATDSAEYLVTVVYKSLGESRRSNSATIGTGIDEVRITGDASYYNLNGMRLNNASNASGVTIKVVDGKAQKVLMRR